MVSESPMTMMPRAMMGGGGEDLEKELGLLLRRQDASDRERELNIYRSGSAPPTVEGSLFSRPGLTDEELRSDPRYLSYYYSNVNLNPRLPPPVLSKEDWRSTQRFQSGFGGIGDKRNRNNDHRPPPSEELGGGGSSLFSLQPRFQPEDPNAAGEWLDKGGDGLIGLPGFPLGRQNSFADIFQDDVGRKTPLPNHPSRPASRSAFSSGSETLGSEDKLALHHVGSSDSMQPIGQNVVGAKNSSVSASQTFASVLGKSLSRSTTPDPQLVARAPSPRLPPVGARLNNTDKKHNNGSCSLNSVKAGMAQSNDLVASLSIMNLSTSGGADDDIMAQSKLQQEIMNHQKFLFGSQGAQDHTNQSSLRNSDLGYLSVSSIPQLPKSSYPELARKNGGLLDRNNSVPPANSYLRRPSSPSVVSPGGSSVHLNTDIANATFTGYGLSGYSVSPALSPTMASQIGSGNLPPLYENAAAAAAVSAIGSPGMGSKSLGSIPLVPNLSGVTDFQNLTRIGNPSATSTLQMPFFDPVYVQYLRAMEYAAQVAANYGDPSMDMGYMTNSYTELLGMQKAYLGTLLQPQKSHDMPFLGKSGGLNSGYFGSPAFGGMSYPGSPLANPILPGSPVGHGSPLRHGDRSIHFPSSLRNFSGGVMGSWQSDSGNLGENYPSSLLDEFKSNKTKCYELSEIAGHVVEFSADQYGSRFIQQKLETATTEDKDMVFEEIMPQAFSLMTDVFGNYVIQKFFEHGSAAQRRELADQLSGHVLTLSLQMYGCRVIQKAIEVVDLDQQTKMVAELDGHIMRCVRDQNGNHVIQKCIECVPQDAIHFIISSFYEQVVTLSTHPYGCRVIQRVLEHCDDPKTQQIMMDEIMGSVCMLAQDQYGNYVVQHVLEHGKPYERSAIITKLTGQIVQMSQQKFASNVVEKCLTHGDQEERRILISEMLGSTEENEPLQAMMKDQFANYVVQKVLETCDEAQREHILSRIKVHLNALKKYTYGKHIVARVEKLVAAGERRMGVQSSYTS